MERITLEQWNQASEQQRRIWLKDGMLVRDCDLEALEAQIAKRQQRAAR